MKNVKLRVVYFVTTNSLYYRPIFLCVSVDSDSYSTRGVLGEWRGVEGSGGEWRGVIRNPNNDISLNSGGGYWTISDSLLNQHSIQ